jgi:hypothetical protein
MTTWRESAGALRARLQPDLCQRNGIGAVLLSARKTMTIWLGTRSACHGSKAGLKPAPFVCHRRRRHRLPSGRAARGSASFGIDAGASLPRLLGPDPEAGCQSDLGQLSRRRPPDPGSYRKVVCRTRGVTQAALPRIDTPFFPHAAK